MTHLLYIDPGSGSFLVQAIIAAVLGVGFFFKAIGRFFVHLWWRIRTFFSRPQKEKKNDFTS